MPQKYLDSDITLKRFNHFIVLKTEPNKNGQRQVLTVCDCGETSVRPLQRVVSGFIKACNSCKQGLIHLSKDPLYKIWCGIKGRCFNSNRREYSRYGGRGISMFPEWINDPLAFITFCKNNGWSIELQIDRINNDGNYEPTNIRFVNAQVNMSNTSINKHCTLDGSRMTLSEASRKLGKSRDYLCSIQTRMLHLKPSNVVFCD
jgi:hypothetical protein